MITNLGSIDTTDEERLAIGQALGIGKMVTRKQLKEAVYAYLAMLAQGKEIEQSANQETEGVAEEQSPPERDRSVPDFVPSRGDEPYLYSPQDPELAAQCSAVLNGLEYIERYAWDALERNRK